MDQGEADRLARLQPPEEVVEPIETDPVADDHAGAGERAARVQLADDDIPAHGIVVPRAHRAGVRRQGIRPVPQGLLHVLDDHEGRVDQADRLDQPSQPGRPSMGCLSLSHVLPASRPGRQKGNRRPRATGNLGQSGRPGAHQRRIAQLGAGEFSAYSALIAFSSLCRAAKSASDSSPPSSALIRSTF